MKPQQHNAMQGISEKAHSPWRTGPMRVHGGIAAVAGVAVHANAISLPISIQHQVNTVL